MLEGCARSNWPLRCHRIWHERYPAMLHDPTLVPAAAEELIDLCRKKRPAPTRSLSHQCSASHHVTPSRYQTRNIRPAHRTE
eukprot:3163955-Rhodomonas_salina.5